MKKDCIQSFWFFFEKRTAGQKSNGYFTFGKICNEVYRPNEERSFFMAFSTSKKDTSIRSSPHASGKSRMERPLLRTASRMAFITFCRVGSSLKKRQCLTAIVRVSSSIKKRMMKGYVSRIQRKSSSLHVFQRCRHVYPSSRCSWMQPYKPITFSSQKPFLYGKSPVCETYNI